MRARYLDRKSVMPSIYTQIGHERTWFSHCGVLLKAVVFVFHMNLKGDTKHSFVFSRSSLDSLRESSRRDNELWTKVHTLGWSVTQFYIKNVFLLRIFITLV